MSSVGKRGVPVINEKLKKFEEMCNKIKCGGNKWFILLVCYELFCSLTVEKGRKKYLGGVSNTLDECLGYLKFAENYISDSVFKSSDKNKKNVVQEVYTLYEECWLQLEDKYYFDETKKLLATRFKRNKISSKLIKDSYVLDLGSGSGRYTHALYNYKPKKIVGIDLGERAVRFARKQARKMGAKIEFRVASALEIPYEDETFDFVFCNGVLHHTTNPLKGLREIHRVLKKSGKAWVYLYNSDGIYWAARKIIKEIVKDIPREMGFSLLAKVGIQSNRIFYFMDAAYVPIEENYLRKEAEDMFRKVGFKSTKFLSQGADRDKTQIVHLKQAGAKQMFGEYGELRFLIGK